MKKEQGITLISLVVTIIVLIILAGVSINLILGQDGIINKAKEAKQNMEYAQIEEQEQLNTLYDQMSGEGSGGLSYDAMAKLVEFKREIASAITDMGVETAANADATTMASNIKSILNNTNASLINYDNTESGLEADNVQSAIDELDNSLNSLLITKQIIAPEITIEINKSISTQSVDATLDGYKLIGVIGFNLVSGWLDPIQIRVSENFIQYSLANRNTVSAITTSPIFYGLYIKN